MAENNKTVKKHLRCPYCDDDIAELQYPYCQACKLEVNKCPECGKAITAKDEKCPACGASLKGKC